MKTRTIIIVIIVAFVAGIVAVLNSQSIMMSSNMTRTDCYPEELLHDGKCIKIDVPEHIGSFTYGTDSITSYCEEISEPGDGFGLDRCIRIEFLDTAELLSRIQNNSTEPLTWPSSKMLTWCAERFDHTKHEFQENLKKNQECNDDVCPEYEPPLFESALNEEEFIEKECARFVDKWAYMTEDNDYTWSYVNWESFVKRHYMHPVDDPQRNEKCARLFDLIYQSKEDSDLWYELTETDEFRNAKCASMVEDWEHLTEYNVWDIGISWKKVAEFEETFEDTDDSFEAVPQCKGEGLCLREKITRIIDGDTLYLGDYKIRLSLTNTPERHEIGFHDASKFTAKMCPVGTVALVDQDDLQPYDVYDRILGKVVCENKVLNSELLYAGHANILTQYCHASEFTEEAWAQEFGC